MKYAFIDAHRDQAPVEHLCGLLTVARSGYYHWQDKTKRILRKERDQADLEAILRIFVASHETYGSPRIHATMQQEGIVINRKRVARLMRLHEIVPHPTRRFQGLSKRIPGRAAAPNLLQQRFVGHYPNHVWLVDSSEFATHEGKVYLSLVEDLYTRKVVSWQAQSHFNTALVCATLCQALAHYHPECVHALIHHSDQGSQYTSREYTALLVTHKIHSSMSDVGNCYDNAPIESFFATLKKEWTHGFVWSTRKQLIDELAAFIDGFYNTVRLHSALGFLAPMDFERQYYEQQQLQLQLQQQLRREENNIESLHPEVLLAPHV